MLAAGPEALERRAEVFALFADRMRRLHAIARRQEPALAELVEPAVCATLALFRDRTGRADAL